MPFMRSKVQIGGVGTHPLQEQREVSKLYAQLGPLEVHLTSKRADILKAMRLRFEVFYEEMSAKTNTLAHLLRLDRDAYDKICEHLLVFDSTSQKKLFQGNFGPQAIATYRILRQEVAQKTLGFYTQQEFNLDDLIKRKSADCRFMELGRSCVRKEYRSKRCIELLWKGLWTYAQEHGINVMIGCASFDGTDPQKYSQALSYLYHHALAQNEWHCKAHASLYQKMNIIPKDEIKVLEALKQMPPLIKGYLRLGAFVGDGAVIDKQFGTIDILIILPIDRINPRYFEHFGHPEDIKLKRKAA